jgi:hypothetical protein
VYHDGKWHRLGHSTTQNCPTLGPHFSLASTYDIVDNLSDYQPPVNAPTLDLGDLTLALPDPDIELAPQAQAANVLAAREQPKESEESDSESETSEESINQDIRNSPITIPKPLHPTLAQIKPITMATETMYMTHMAEQPNDGGPSTIGTAISMSTAQQIHQSLQQSMR